MKIEEPAVLKPETSFRWRRWVNIGVIGLCFWQINKITDQMAAGTFTQAQADAISTLSIVAIISLAIYMTAPTAELLAKIIMAGGALKKAAELSPFASPYTGYEPSPEELK